MKSKLTKRNKDMFVAFWKKKAVPKFVNIAFIASKRCFWQWLISWKGRDISKNILSPSKLILKPN